MEITVQKVIDVLRDVALGKYKVVRRQENSYDLRSQSVVFNTVSITVISANHLEVEIKTSFKSQNVIRYKDFYKVTASCISAEKIIRFDTQEEYSLPKSYKQGTLTALIRDIVITIPMY